MNPKAKNPLITIVTATYNSEKTILRTVQSILNQTYKNIEYIIADGSSVDGTLEVVKQYKKQFQDSGIILKIISSPDGGIYAGMNKGICMASGDVVGILNGDDWYSEDMVACIVRKYCECQFDMCYCDDYVVDSRNNIIKSTHVKVMKHYLTTRHWSHGTMFVDRKIYLKRLYDESFRYYADWDFTLWVYRNYPNIVVINKPLLYFCLGGVSTKTGIKTTLKKMEERYRAYRNNGYSRIYFLECISMDFGKNLVMNIINLKNKLFG